MEWKKETWRSILQMNKEKLIFVFCSGLLLFILSLPGADVVSLHLPATKETHHLFNAETIIEGLAAGLVGIGLTELLLIPINSLIKNIAGISAKAYLDPTAALILVIISVMLTFIAGLIPARSAAKKDPVVALRTE